MKNQKNKDQTLQLPVDIQTRCGFEDADAITVKSAEGVCVIHKREMKVLDVAHAISALNTIAGDMMVALAAACGFCDQCGERSRQDTGDGGPSAWAAECALCRSLLEREELNIPDDLLEEAGIPTDAKLEAYADDETGEITVVESDCQQDISDIPPGVLSVLAASGVCLAQLDELIMLEETIYGK